MDYPLVISAPPREGEYEVECVTAAMTDHADPQWMYLCLTKIVVGDTVRAPDLALANDVITDVWQDRENRLYTKNMPGRTPHCLALFRIRFAGCSKVSVNDEALTVDAVRALAPGTVIYCRRERRLWVRGTGAPSHMLTTGFSIFTLYADLLTDNPSTFLPSGLTYGDIERFDLCVVCDASDAFVLK